jgi:hypothetical protein
MSKLGLKEERNSAAGDRDKLPWERDVVRDGDISSKQSGPDGGSGNDSTASKCLDILWSKSSV